MKSKHVKAPHIQELFDLSRNYGTFGPGHECGTPYTEASRMLDELQKQDASRAATPTRKTKNPNTKEK